MRTIVLTVFLAFLSGTVNAAQAADLISGAFDATSKKTRIEIAVDIKRRLGQFSQYLPTQKSQESSWVEREQDEIAKLTGPAKYSRIVQLAESMEFQQSRLQDKLSATTDALDCIADASRSAAREMFCWSVASVNLTDERAFDDAIAILLKAGRLPPAVKKEQVLGSESLGYWAVFAWYGRGIHEHILTPYLRQQAR